MKEQPGRLVYVVDDEPVIARTLAEILKLSGSAAEPFTSGEDALGAAKANPPSL